MTNKKKVLMASAALAGLLAGTSATIQDAQVPDITKKPLSESAIFVE
jgi:hypothetical protein